LWLIDTADAAALQHRLFGTQMMALESQRRALHVGVMNRRGSRKIVGADSLMGGFVQVLSRDVRTYTLSHVDEVGELSFAEQAAWTHSQDILFAPRGAQNINFLWVRPCTVILEIFPHSYYIPGEYLQLAKAAGAITFSAYDGLHPEHDTLRTPSDFHLRVTARAASFTSSTFVHQSAL